jgi:hypothetical protein
MNAFIWLLDQEHELAAKFEGKIYCQECICIMPNNPEETTFPLLPFSILMDYYNPAFFNSLQPGLCKKIAGISQTVGLLPNVLQSFGHGPDNCPHPDERLGERAFNKKYGPDVLAQYMLEDLDGVDVYDSEDDEYEAEGEGEGEREREGEREGEGEVNKTMEDQL